MKNSKVYKILHHSKPWSFILLGTIVFLMWMYFYKIGKISLDTTFKDSFETFWQWLDPVAGIMTFLTTLTIFWFQAKQKWEDSLEKMLTVEYIYTGGKNEKIIAIVENAYLSGESDIRQWAQSLGGQIMGNLDFDMNWDEEKEKIVFHENKYFKSHNIKLYLTSDPKEIENDNKKGKMVMEEFLKRKFKYSTVEGNIDHFPIIWKRK